MGRSNGSTKAVSWGLKGARIVALVALPLLRLYGLGFDTAQAQTNKVEKPKPGHEISVIAKQIGQAAKLTARQGSSALALHVLSVHSGISASELEASSEKLPRLAREAMVARVTGSSLGDATRQLGSGLSVGEVVVNSGANQQHATILLNAALAGLNANARAAAKGLADTDDDGTPNAMDDDADDDGIPNGQDDDVDGDDTPNASDDDVDGDGMDNSQDDDVDGDDDANVNDDDIDGDHHGNSDDADDDGDGVDDDADSDDDGDGTADGSDDGEGHDQGDDNGDDAGDDNGGNGNDDGAGDDNGGNGNDDGAGDDNGGDNGGDDGAGDDNGGHGGDGI